MLTTVKHLFVSEITNTANNRYSLTFIKQVRCISDLTRHKLHTNSFSKANHFHHSLTGKWRTGRHFGRGIQPPNTEKQSSPSAPTSLPPYFYPLRPCLVFLCLRFFHTPFPSPKNGASRPGKCWKLPEWGSERNPSRKYILLISW